MDRAYDSQGTAGSVRWAAGPNNSAAGPDMGPFFGCAEFWHSSGMSFRNGRTCSGRLTSARISGRLVIRQAQATGLLNIDVRKR